MWRFLAPLSLCLVLASQFNCSGAVEPADEPSDASVADTKVTVDTPGVKEDSVGTGSGTLILNEVAPSGAPNDWIELYNPGSAPVDISSWTLTDLKTEPTKGSFPANTVIQPGEYKVFYFDDNWPGFKLGGDEEIYIFDAQGKQVDGTDWEDGAAPAGKSWGRIADRTGPFKTLHTPTPGAANKDGAAPTEPGKEPVGEDAGPGPEPRPEPPTPDTSTPSGKLVINEVAAAGDPDDWFELYNGTGQDIDLSDHSVSDTLNDETKRVKFPKGTVIKAGEFKVFFTKDDPWPGFKLGKDEELGLYDGKGDLVDSVDWNDGDSPSGKSYGRSPDGSGKFKPLDKQTPNAANQ